MEKDEIYITIPWRINVFNLLQTIQRTFYKIHVVGFRNLSRSLCVLHWSKGAGDPEPYHQTVGVWAQNVVIYISIGLVQTASVHPPDIYSFKLPLDIYSFKLKFTKNNIIYSPAWRYNDLKITKAHFGRKLSKKKPKFVNMWGREWKTNIWDLTHIDKNMTLHTLCIAFCAGGIMNYLICYHKEQKDPAENKILSFCRWFAKNSYIRLPISKTRNKVCHRENNADNRIFDVYIAQSIHDLKP